MTDRRQFHFNILTLAVGILIPILVAVIPYAAQKFSPEQELVFSLVGPVSIKGVTALEITVKNLGTKPAVGTKILVESSPEYVGLISKGAEKKDPISRILVDSKVPVKVSMSGKYYVLDVGNLRSKEVVTVKIGTTERALSLYGAGKYLDGVEVKSDDFLGTFDEPSEWQEFFYPLGFWMFIVMFVGMIGIGIYQQYFMDPRERERLILREIDRLEASRTAGNP